MPEFIRVFIKNQHLPKDTGWTQQLTNDAGKYSEDWGLQTLKETLNKRLIMSHKGNLTEILCGDEVPWDYIYDTFTEADIIIVSFDKKGKKIGSVRGFACVKVNYNAKDQPFLYIDLICNAVAARTRASKQTYPSGTTILAVIKALAEGKFKEAKEAGIPKCDFIKLRALESVITYYTLFGWEFLGKDDNTACKRKRGQRNRINKIVLKKLRKVLENPRSTEGEKKKALRPFNAHLDDFYKDKDISSKQFRKEQEDMDGWRFSGTREVRDYRKREDGYTMYKCLTGARGKIHNEIEKNRKGDYRLSLKQVGINKTANIEIYYGRNLPRDLRPKNTDREAFSIFRQAEKDDEETDDEETDDEETDDEETDDEETDDEETDDEEGEGRKKTRKQGKKKHKKKTRKRRKHKKHTKKTRKRNYRSIRRSRKR